jgi:predicted lipid-binding transport protein (Tim44 family)
MKSLTLTAAVLLMTVSSLSWAQSAADHPEQKEAPAATQPTPPAGQRRMGSSQGMMGSGSMMNMMGGKMPMMQMMEMMHGMRGMATIDHVEGRIAFLRTELKITDAQTSAADLA